MILTKEEFNALGFAWSDDKELESCLERAGFVLTALTQGKAAAALAAGGEAARLVKQAAAFQTLELLRREYGTGSGRSGEENSEKYTVGDFSYSVTKSTESSTTAVEPYDSSLAVIGLLRAAGCLFSGVEAIE